MASNSTVGLGILALAIFTHFANHTRDMYKEGRTKSVFGALFLATIPLFAFLFIWTANEGPSDMLRNIVLGLIGAIAGASALIWLGYFVDNKAKTTVEKDVASPPVSAPAVPPTLPAAASKQFTTQTIRSLKALYDGRTALQADALVRPYKGLWINTTGEVILINSNPAALLKNGDDTIECWFGKEWANVLGRYGKSDPMQVIGKISEVQNGAQIYLAECEIVGTTPN
ncbi:hypothetical protein [Tardiphaga robiniae]|uniref:hypothetical protein n=1 Tax=Tardiphaga robiniae TaxID=943830 RepID=UPI001586A877|nr:hypothetical protein [Tardiphaga robiniae]NUU42295.1 hypothetical protein [Tardiphaga robiniae]